MKRPSAFVLILLAGFAGGWLVRRVIPEAQAEPELGKMTGNASLLGEVNQRWLDHWEDELADGNSTPFKINRWRSEALPEDQQTIALLAHRDPEAAMAWIREHVEEEQREQLMRRHVIGPLMAVDCERAVALLDSIVTEPKMMVGNSQFWLFSSAPIAQWPKLASILQDLDEGSFLRETAFPQFVAQWSAMDLEAATSWVEQEVVSDDALAQDLRALIAAARVKEGLIPQGLESALAKARPAARKQILSNLYEAALRIPGDPAEHVNQVLALTPAEEQMNKANSFVMRWAQADPLPASEWALSFEDREQAISLLSTAVSGFYQTEPTRAEAWFQSRSPEERSMIEEAREFARKHNRMPPP